MPFHVMPNELLRGGNFFSSRGRKVTLTVVTAVTQVTPWVKGVDRFVSLDISKE